MPEHSVTEVLAERDRAVSRGEYEYLGRIKHIRVSKDGTPFYLELRKSGPPIARMRDGSLSILGPIVLPSIPRSDQGACPDCQAKCGDCAGKGKRLCTRPFCGGRGKIAIIGQPEKEQKTCDACAGTGQAPCALCEGTGLASTGYLKGATPASNTLNTPPPCPTCNGRRRVFGEVKQDLRALTVAMLEGMQVVGPVEAIGFFGDEHTAEQQGSIETMPDLDGAQMVLLLTAERAWLWGGLVRPAPQQL